MYYLPNELKIRFLINLTYSDLMTILQISRSFNELIKYHVFSSLEPKNTFEFNFIIKYLNSNHLIIPVQISDINSFDLSRFKYIEFNEKRNYPICNCGVVEHSNLVIWLRDDFIPPIILSMILSSIEYVSIEECVIISDESFKSQIISDDDINILCGGGMVTRYLTFKNCTLSVNLIKKLLKLNFVRIYNTVSDDITLFSDFKYLNIEHNRIIIYASLN